MGGENEMHFLPEKKCLSFDKMKDPPGFFFGGGGKYKNTYMGKNLVSKLDFFFARCFCSFDALLFNYLMVLFIYKLLFYLLGE